MHHYLKSIGFDDSVSKTELFEILKQAEKDFTSHELVYQDNELDYCEYVKEYGAGIGICVFGDMDIDSNFERQYYFPFLIGTGKIASSDVTIERRTEEDAYIGICDDPEFAISLIFHIQNNAEFLKEVFNKKDKIRFRSITLSALCNEGMILLPIMKNAYQSNKQKEEDENRKLLIDAAKEGDQSAIESLTLDEFHTYTTVAKRLVKEDVFSIVETSLMPHGVECDKYSILGTILSYYIIENEYTKEPLYIMKLEVNNFQFDLCVPVHRVVGEPDVGRRFKGVIWLQGKINF